MRSLGKALTVVTIALGVISTTAFAQELDPTFTAELTSRSGHIALQADGKILLAGDIQDLGEFQLVRFNADGTRDPSFTYPFSNTLGIWSVAALPDGKILVAGLLSVGGGPVVARLLHNGAVDPSFNGAVYGSVFSMAVQADGKVLVGGVLSTSSGGSTTGSLYRLNDDGSIDGSFAPTINGPVHGLAVQPDGRVLIIGTFTQVNGVDRHGLVRLDTNGALDAGFEVQIPGQLSVGLFQHALVVRPDGRILFSGMFIDVPNPTKLGVFQLHTNGALDTSFSAQIDQGTVSSIALQPDGRLIAAGSFNRVNGIKTFRLTRLLLDGSVDLSFGIDGSTLGGHSALPYVLLQPDGKVLASGGPIPRGLSRYLAATPDPVETDVAITKTASTGAMVNGGIVVYTITVKNHSPTTTAAGITVSDTLPAGLTFASCSATLQGVCSGLGNQRTITYAGIAPGQSSTISLGANVTPAAGETVVNTATVTSYSPDPVSANNSASATSYRNPPVLADLRITKTASTPTATPGGTLAYTLTVTNDGPNAASAVVVSDTLPAGVTFVSCTAPGGTCGGAGNARTVSYASLASGASRTITVNVSVNADAVAAFTNTATVTSSTQDPTSANNASSVTTTTTVDTDGDGLPTEWETRFGLRGDASSGNDGRNGDPDGDGRPNIQELADGTHPRGFAARYLAEGAANTFFDVRLALLNVGTQEARVLIRFLQPGGAVVSRFLPLAAGRRGTLTRDDLSELSSPDFSTVVESDQPLVLDRTMTWGGGSGSHAETGVPTPSTTWYLAEGSTSGEFSLFYLLQNPNATSTTATVRYLLPFGTPPIVRTYDLPPFSRVTIPVDDQGEGLTSTDVSAVITAPVPIIVERAMYRSTPTVAFAAGHGSMGVTAPATHWFLAEGATGPFFDCFILLANPNGQPANLTIDYLLSDGTTHTKSYVVPAEGRFTVWVDNEEIPDGSGLKPLDNVAVSSTITSDLPIIVERTMWWPSPAITPDYWTEAHNSPGATQTATTWALAEGEVGGSAGSETYILIANTSAFAGQARVRLYFEDGTSAERTVPLPARSRTNVNVSVDVPEAAGRRFGALIESLGSTPAQIVVERAMYTSPGGVTWAGGTNALATRLR